VELSINSGRGHISFIPERLTFGILGPLPNPNLVVDSTDVLDETFLQGGRVARSTLLERVVQSCLAQLSMIRMSRMSSTFDTFDSLPHLAQVRH
jgi:hypothetical protein